MHIGTGTGRGNANVFYPVPNWIQMSICNNNILKRCRETQRLCREGVNFKKSSLS